MISVLVSEFMLSTQGLGHFISIAYDGFDIADMYAGILIMALITLLSTSLISLTQPIRLEVPSLIEDPGEADFRANVGDSPRILVLAFLASWDFVRSGPEPSPRSSTRSTASPRSCCT